MEKISEGNWVITIERSTAVGVDKAVVPKAPGKGWNLIALCNVGETCFIYWWKRSLLGMITDWIKMIKKEK